MSFVKSATVQPQVGLAARISRSVVPVFLTSKLQSSFSPLGTVPKSLIGSVSVRRGVFAASAALGSSATTNGASVRAKATVVANNRFDIAQNPPGKYDELCC